MYFLFIIEPAPKDDEGSNIIIYIIIPIVLIVLIVGVVLAFFYVRRRGPFKRGSDDHPMSQRPNSFKGTHRTLSDYS